MKRKLEISYELAKSTLGFHGKDWDYRSLNSIKDVEEHYESIGYKFPKVSFDDLRRCYMVEIDTDKFNSRTLSL